MSTALQKLLDEASRDGDINKLMLLLDPELLDKFDHDVSEREPTDNPLHIAASHGHVDFISEVLQLKPQLAEKVNGEGRLPLHLAAARGHLQVIEKLADQCGQKALLCADSKYGYMPAHVAAINGENNIVKILVARCKDVLVMTTHRKETLLHLAVIASCLDSVQFLINQGVDLNGKDVDGNTCLHLACKKRNHQVITYLLDQDGIEVNSTNSRGLTPLDVLLLSSWDSPTDAFLVNALRKAGGKEATEEGNLESNLSSTKKASSSTNKKAEKQSDDSQTLLIVATLVATMTFPAISSPPGGFIQLPFDKGDVYNSTFYDDWKGYTTFPSGRPVLLWQLKSFLVLDSVALFSSISVILFLLCGIPRTKIVMKFLAAVLWLAAFCTALAFASVILVIYVPDSEFYVTDDNNYWFLKPDVTEEYYKRISWVYSLLIAWTVVYVIAALWASVRVIIFLWRKGGFKTKSPNWVSKLGWPKNVWFTKTTSVIFIVCFLVILSLATWGVWLGFGESLSKVDSIYDFVPYTATTPAMSPISSPSSD